MSVVEVPSAKARVRSVKTSTHWSSGSSHWLLWVTVMCRVL